VSVGGFGVTQAALSVRSDPYLTRIETESLSTSLIETGLDGRGRTRSGEGDLLQDLKALNDKHEFRLGQEYDRMLAVGNDGVLPEYVRVSVYRYWTDADGRRVDLDPSLIRLAFDESDGWHMDDSASDAAERTVMWYERVLDPDGVTPPFATKFSLDERVASEFARYGNVRFHVEVVVDAIQTHNAEAAMGSAWGHAYDVIRQEGGE
jgi:hypothetical protein